MRYPSITEYNELIENKEITMLDRELKKYNIKLNKFGLPQSYPGNFAVTYKFTGIKKYAVRFFIKNLPNIEKRYEIVNSYFNKNKPEYLINFDFISKGIKTYNNEYLPFLKMEWVEGLTLGNYINKNINNKNEIKNIQKEIEKLSSDMEERKISHGDLQNENIIIDKYNKLKLVDYDSLYVPKINCEYYGIWGHEDFQHPRKEANETGSYVDRFPLIIIWFSLEIIKNNPEFFNKYNSGNNIIFRKSDYIKPETSCIFNELLKIPKYRIKTERLISLCFEKNINNLPNLNEFITGITKKSRLYIIIKNIFEKKL